jgi:hypothetical protein
MPCPVIRAMFSGGCLSIFFTDMTCSEDLIFFPMVSPSSETTVPNHSGLHRDGASRRRPLDWCARRDENGLA